MPTISSRALYFWAKAILCMVFLGLVIHFPTHAMVVQQKLVAITSDDFPNEEIRLVLDLSEQGDIQGVRLHTYNLKGEKIKDGVPVDPQQILEGGLTLLTKDDYKIVTLKSGSFAIHNGGEIIVDYVKNGIRGTRNNLNVELNRQGDTWKLITPEDGRTITGLHFKSDKLFNKSIGIAQIQIIGEESSTKISDQLAADGRPSCI
ncbi:MAG: hypothetical protein WCG27_07445 [Pseudomonadota bacterium]